MRRGTLIVFWWDARPACESGRGSFSLASLVFVAKSFKQDGGGWHYLTVRERSGP